MQIDDLLQLKSFESGGDFGSGLEISPDGRLIAYAIILPPELNQNRTASGEGLRQLWVMRVGSTAISLCATGVDCWAPVWSPNGKKLAFYIGSKGHISVGVWDVLTSSVDDTHAQVVTDGLAAQWTPDGTHLLIPAPAETGKPTAVSPSPEPSSTPSYVIFNARPQTGTGGEHVVWLPPWQDPLTNLSSLDVESGDERVIAAAIRPTTYTVSPDGAGIVYAVAKGTINSDINARVIFDVKFAPFSGRDARTIGHNIVSDFGAFTLTWSHDANMLAYIGGTLETDSRPTSQTSNTGGIADDVTPGSLYIMDLRRAGSPPKRYGQNNLMRGQGSLLWTADDSSVCAVGANTRQVRCLSLQGKRPSLISIRGARFKGRLRQAGQHKYAISITDSGETQIRELNLQKGTTEVLDSAFRSISGLSLSQNGNKAVFISEDMSHPADVWLASEGFRRACQVTHLDAIVEQRALGTRTVRLSWRSGDGGTVSGTILLPAHYSSGRRYPTIVWVYGGDNQGTTDRDAFGFIGTAASAYFNLQLFASRGYAVFVPDIPLAVGSPMTDIAKTVLPGVDRVVAMGIADRNRLGVFGQSYGGYTTLSLIAQTSRFKAAVATSGVSDLLTMYGELHSDGTDWTGWSESGQGRMGASPWKNRARYIANSPFFYLDRVTTPVLLEYGESDETVNPFNSRMTFVALRRLNKTATLIGYAGAEHVLDEPSQIRDFSKRLLGWFGKYLGVSDE